MFSLYRNPDLDDRFLASMAAVQTDDIASYPFVGDFNGHHQEWLCSTTTSRRAVAAFDFASLRLRSVGCWTNPWMCRVSDPMLNPTRAMVRPPEIFLLIQANLLTRLIGAAKPSC